MLPLAIDAERAIIGACMMDAECLDLALSAGLKEGHFETEKHVKTWRLMVNARARGRSIEALPLAHVARARIDELGGYVYLTEHPTFACIKESVTAYARIIIESYARRQLKAWALAFNDIETMDNDEIKHLVGKMSAVSTLLEETKGISRPCNPPER